LTYDDTTAAIPAAKEAKQWVGEYYEILEKECIPIGHAVNPNIATVTSFDQVIFIQQGGRNRHEHICESLELFAAEVMPEFKERDAEQQRKKSERLAPHIDSALQRKQWMPTPGDDEIPEIEALGRQIVQEMEESGRDDSPP